MAIKKSAPKGKARSTPARKTPKRGSNKKVTRSNPRTQDLPLWTKTWPRIVARAWSDPTFFAKLKRDPTAVFKEYNLPVIPDFEFEVRAGTDKPLVTLYVPPKPAHAGKERVADITADDELSPPKTCTNTCAF